MCSGLASSLRNAAAAARRLPPPARLHGPSSQLPDWNMVRLEPTCCASAVWVSPDASWRRFSRAQKADSGQGCGHHVGHRLACPDCSVARQAWSPTGPGTARSICCQGRSPSLLHWASTDGPAPISLQRPAAGRSLPRGVRNRRDRPAARWWPVACRLLQARGRPSHQGGAGRCHRRLAAPLPAAMLEEAGWFDGAMAQATAKIKGAVAPLTAVRIRRGAGAPDGYLKRRAVAHH
jgi:hypothetical protein